MLISKGVSQSGNCEKKIFKKSIQRKIGVFAISSLILGLSSVGQAEDWKGESHDKELNIGGMAGMGIIDSTVGVAVVGTASKKILDPGFVPALNNTVVAEVQIGPVFLPVGTGLLYSAHLRWNFEKDDTWTFYGLGGFGGNLQPGGRPGEFSPRFGVGTFVTLSPILRLRAEISHNLIGFGVTFPL